MGKYPNKRSMVRKGNSRFRKAILQDVGIGGVCPKCRHLLLHHYDGDPRNPHPDPRRFRYRCFTCEPLTEAEKILQDEITTARHQSPSILDILRSAAPVERKESQ